MRPLILSSREATLYQLARDLGVALPPPLVRADHHVALRRMAEEAGIVIPPLVLSSPEAAAKYLVDNAPVTDGGGGGGAPEWVPDGAQIYIEPAVIDGFPEGRAYVDGVGIVDVDALLGHDDNFASAWGPNDFEPALVTADGYDLRIGTPGVVAFIGAALIKILAGCTIVIRLKGTADSGGTFTVFLVVDDDGGSAAVEYDLSSGVNKQAEAFSWGGDLSQTINAVVQVGASSINQLAITLTSTRSEMAVNNSSPDAASLTTDDYPVLGFACAGMVDGGVVQWVAIYDALPTTAGLQALSNPS